LPLSTVSKLDGKYMDFTLGISYKQSAAICFVPLLILILVAGFSGFL
jgi:hypothetical protein